MLPFPTSTSAASLSSVPLTTTQTSAQGFFSSNQRRSSCAEHDPTPTPYKNKAFRRCIFQIIASLAFFWAVSVVFYSLPSTWDDSLLVVSTHNYYRHGSNNDHDAHDHPSLLTVDLSRNDPALRGLSQAECTTFWAPSIVHGMGVYTARDIARKAVAQPLPDLCFRVDNVNVFPSLTAFWSPGRVWLVLTYPFIVKTTPDGAVLCQGLASLMNHMPDDETRAATSKFVVVEKTKQKECWRLATVTHHKVKAGAELTVDYFGMEGLVAGRNTILNQQQTAMKTSIIPERSPEWLREHGHCLDNLRVRGQQAVAARRFAVGDVLVTSPVLKLSSSSANNHTTTTALWLRYCIHTPADHSYYFPYGPGLGYITRRSEDAAPNVALRWATDSPLVQVYALRDITMEEPLVLTVVESQDEDGPLQMEEPAPHQFTKTMLLSSIFQSS
eukprot:scaffold3574_cov171-Amphora_coffeaeformis.AAC.3